MYNEMTFTEYINMISERRYLRGNVTMIKMFDENVDGPWHNDHRRFGSRYNRDYVEVRLDDYLKKESNNSLGWTYVFTLPDGKYLVAVLCKKKSKKFEAFEKFGFKVIVDWTERLAS